MMKAEIRERQQNQRFLLALILVIGGVLVTLIFRLSAEITHDEQSLYWPHTSGRVIKSIGVISSRKYGKDYRADIWFEYKVAGKTYKNDEVRFGMRETKLNDAVAVLNRYPLGGRVTVYYKPDSPHISCLERGTMYVQAYQWLLAVGATLSIICAFFAWKSYRM